jgi:hypothetical protein
VTNIQNAFRILRESWFYRILYSSPHERDWEDEEQEKSREINNIRSKNLFDNQTERIIAGEILPVAPMCNADMFGYNE